LDVFKTVKKKLGSWK